MIQARASVPGGRSHFALGGMDDARRGVQTIGGLLSGLLAGDGARRHREVEHAAAGIASGSRRNGSRQYRLPAQYLVRRPC